MTFRRIFSYQSQICSNCTRTTALIINVFMILMKTSFYYKCLLTSFSHKNTFDALMCTPENELAVSNISSIFKT